MTATSMPTQEQLVDAWSTLARYAQERAASDPAFAAEIEASRQRVATERPG